MILQPVKVVKDAMTRVAEGDLMHGVDVARADEIGELGKTANKMIGDIRKLVVRLQRTAEKTAGSAQQISMNSNQMSQGTSEQAATAEEALSAVEEMDATIRQNADNASQTEKIAQKSAQYALDSGEEVFRTVVAMKDIAGRISIVEEIARQTNLLALNAAIEAARGDCGGAFFPGRGAPEGCCFL
jgi:methyl-accepting chemotaxis protein